MGARDKIIVIGGSAGSIPLILQIVSHLSNNFTYPLIFVIHRQKNTLSNMDAILAQYSGSRPVVEPEDKQPILKRHIYLAPQNYHLLIEDVSTFSLDYSEPVHHCRPSIDVAFQSAATTFGQNTVGVLLSGANTDGAKGLTTVLHHKGQAIVQLPATAGYPLMPQSAIAANPSIIPSTPNQIIEIFKNNSF